MEIKDVLGITVAAAAVLVASIQIGEANRYLNAGNAYAVENDLTEAAFDVLAALDSETTEFLMVERQLLYLDFRFAHASSLAGSRALDPRSWEQIKTRICEMFEPQFGGVLRDGSYRLEAMKEQCV